MAKAKGSQNPRPGTRSTTRPGTRSTKRKRRKSKPARPPERRWRASSTSLRGDARKERLDYLREEAGLALMVWNARRAVDNAFQALKLAVEQLSRVDLEQGKQLRALREAMRAVLRDPPGWNAGYAERFRDAWRLAHLEWPDAWLEIVTNPNQPPELRESLSLALEAIGVNRAKWVKARQRSAGDGLNAREGELVRALRDDIVRLDGVIEYQRRVEEHLRERRCAEVTAETADDIPPIGDELAPYQEQRDREPDSEIRKLWTELIDRVQRVAENSRRLGRLRAVTVRDADLLVRAATRALGGSYRSSRALRLVNR